MKSVITFIFLIGFSATAKQWQEIIENSYYKVSESVPAKSYCLFYFSKDTARNQLHIWLNSPDCSKYSELDHSLETLDCEDNICTSEMKEMDLKGLRGQWLANAEYRKITLIKIPNTKQLLLQVYLRAKSGMFVGNNKQEEVIYRLRIEPN